MRIIAHVRWDELSSALLLFSFSGSNAKVLTMQIKPGLIGSRRAVRQSRGHVDHVNHHFEIPRTLRPAILAPTGIRRKRDRSPP
jgi:hypothetical protein